MRDYNNVVIVFPYDPTIEFLNPLTKILLEIFPNSQIFRPEPDTYGSAIDDETDLIIFLGHGTPNQLFGSLRKDSSRSLFLNIQTGALLLNEVPVIIFACNSWDYLKKVKTVSSIDTYLAFGDMPTDWKHINHNRKLKSDYLMEFKDEHLEYYKSALVEIMVDGFRNGFKTNSLIGLVKRIEHSVSTKINHVIFSTEWNKDQKLQMISLLVDFKKTIKYSKPI